MLGVKFCFWIFLVALLYIYFGYPLLLALLGLFRQSQTQVDETYEPPVSLIIAAYNEEAVIGEKIENSLKLDYPKEKLEIIVFSDASTDRTDEIVKSYADKGVKLLRIEGRKGKTYCQNETMRIAKGEIIVFSDANSMYEPDAIRKLIRRFADPQVGCVVGELRYRSSSGRGESGKGVEGEGLYWRYEQFIKRLESHVSSLVGANGSVYAIRKKLFEPLSPEAQEDFVRPLKIVQKGYRVVYEPEAVAWEETTSKSAMELRRRVRMVARAVFSLLNDRSLVSLLNPLRYGILAIQLWSHKILRWLSGVFLVLVFIFNAFLWDQDPIYRLTLVGQAFFYLLVLIGFCWENRLGRRAPKPIHITYYFCLSCYAMLKGLYYALRGRAFATWEPVRIRSSK